MDNERVFERKKHTGSNSLRVASGVARVAGITRPIPSSSVRPSSSMTGVAIARRGGALLEQRDPRFQGSDLLGFHILIHALSFQSTRSGAFASARSLWLSGLERSDDKVVKLYQYIGWKEVDLELDLFGALQMEVGAHQ